MKKNIKIAVMNDWQYTSEKKQQKKQHKQFRDNRKKCKTLWQSVD